MSTGGPVRVHRYLAAVAEDVEHEGSNEREEWLASVPEEFDDVFWKTLKLKHLIWLESSDMNEQQRTYFDEHKPKVEMGSGFTGTKKLGEALGRISKSFAPKPLNFPAIETPDFTDMFQEYQASVQETLALQAQARAAEVQRQKDMVDALRGVHEELINQRVSGRHSDSVQHAVLVVTVVALMVAVGVPVAIDTKGLLPPAIAVGVVAIAGLLVAWILGVFRRRS